MKQILKILLALLAAMGADAADVLSKEELKGDTLSLLQYYYGDFEYDPGVSLLTESTVNARAVRDELLSRADFTDDMMRAFRGTSGINFAYALLGLGEFGKPSEEDQRQILSIIQKVVAKREQYRARKLEFMSSDWLVLNGAGAYLAGRPSADGEPILLAILRDANSNIGLCYMLRMVQEHPTQARVEALRSRDYNSLSTDPLYKELYADLKKRVDASIVKAEANLRKAQDLPPVSEPKLEPAPANVPAATSSGNERQQAAQHESPSPASSSSHAVVFWLPLSAIALVSLIGIFVWKRRGR